jgi:hypothetical protein
MISNDQVAEFVLTCVQNLVRFAGPEDDALARFNGNRRFRAAHAALTLTEDVHPLWPNLRPIPLVAQTDARSRFSEDFRAGVCRFAPMQPCLGVYAVGSGCGWSFSC